jgi:DNA repair protein RadC
MNEKPDHLGHRKRLRGRFERAGADALNDYELVELLLTYLIPQKDVKTIAKQLLKKFDTLGEMLEKSPEELQQVKGIGPVVSSFFPLLKEVCAEYLKDSIYQTDVLKNPESVANFARVKLSGKSGEIFMAVYVNNQNEVLDQEILEEGSVDHTVIYPRKIVEKAIKAKASGILLIHNHPGGSLKPSNHDKKLTQELKNVGESLDLRLLDHLIVSKNGYKSFRKDGLM